MQNKIIDFWFNELTPEKWWVTDPQLDDLIRTRFGKLHQQATQLELWEWRKTSAGCLAEIILLDQFSRNLYRDDPVAFAYDGIALALAQEAVSRKINFELNPTQRAFLYMPYMHSESLKIHEVALKLFSEPNMEDNLEYERQHKAIIERFGRYPHRNAVLGRVSTPQELEFLKQPGSSF